MSRPRSRLRGADVFSVGSLGLRSRPLRTALSALGVAIGIAAMVAVLGVSASQEQGLLNQIDQLGTNLLTVTPGQTLGGSNAELPRQSTGMTTRVDGVQSASSVAALGASVYLNDHVPSSETAGIAVVASRSDLLAALRGTMAAGSFLNAATEHFPAVVLGAVAAQRLGITAVAPLTQVWLGGHWFTVIGILNPLPLAPNLDSSALVGQDIAASALGWDRAPTTIYVRSDPEQVTAVQGLLAAVANPAHPDQVQVSRPSDALAARAAAKGAFTSLFLGLGAVALVVGAVGIGNVMVIGVLERRSEVGLRRALGAKRIHIALQFLSESVLVSALGGLAGAALGAGATVLYVVNGSLTLAVPPTALAGGVLLAMVVGALAGIYPSLRAARLSPTSALRSA
jgi:putative ABC transport system permease protein